MLKSNFITMIYFNNDLMCKINDRCLILFLFKCQPFQFNCLKFIFSVINKLLCVTKKSKNESRIHLRLNKVIKTFALISCVDFTGFFWRHKDNWKYPSKRCVITCFLNTEWNKIKHACSYLKNRWIKRKCKFNYLYDYAVS